MPSQLRRVLFVAYYYPPLGGVGSQRALSFARYLPEFGFSPVVIAPRRGAYGLDASLGDGDLPGVDVVRTGTLEPAVLLRGGRDTGAASGAGGMVEERAPGLLRRLVHRTLYFPDHGSGWIPFASRAARRAGREAGVVAVVSTSPPVSAHVVGLRAARRLGVPAVLDFRDLWTAHQPASGGGARARAERRLEGRLLRGADALTTVSESWRRWLAARVGDDRRVYLLRNGYEESDFAGAPATREAGVFRIVHAGTVYGRRQDTRALFRALQAVREGGAFGDLRPEVLLAGKVDPDTSRAAEEAGCADLVVRPGFVSHAEAVRLQRAATVNLLLTWTVPGPVAAGVCPGKMYEQMAAGRPILCLALDGCEAGDLLRRTGGALVVRPDDEVGLRRALADLVEAERRGDAAAAAPPPGPDVTSFARRSVASRLAELLASLID